MPGTNPTVTDEERLFFGTVVLVDDHRYGRLLIIATPDYSALDWEACMLELVYRYGAGGVPGKPEWDEEQVWVWDLPIPAGSR